METGTVYADVEGRQIPLDCSFTKRQIQILRCGGLLNYTKEGGL